MTKKKKNEDHTLSLYKRNGVFYVRLYDKETKTFTAAKSTGETNRDDAARKAGEMLVAGEIKTRDSDPLLIDALIEYWTNRKGLTPRYHKSSINYLENFVRPFPEFKKLRLSGVKAYHVNRLADFLEQQGRKPSVINRITQSIKHYLLYAYSRGFISQNLTDGKQIIKKEFKKNRRGELTPPEMMKLAALAWKDHRIKVAVMLGCFAGLRRGEIRALRWMDVDFKTGYIYVRRNFTDIKDEAGVPIYFDPKADSSRNWPYLVFPELRAALLKQWEETPYKKPDDLILPNVWQSNQINQTGADGQMPLPDTAFRNNFYKMLEAIGITPEQQVERRLSFHSTRHSFASFVDMSGSTKTAMSLTGHSTREMLENYTHANDAAVLEHLETANNFLDKFRPTAGMMN